MIYHILFIAYYVYISTLVASAIDPPINGGVVVLEPTFAHLSFAGDGQSERGKVKL